MARAGQANLLESAKGAQLQRALRPPRNKGPRPERRVKAWPSGEAPHLLHTWLPPCAPPTAGDGSLRRRPGSRHSRLHCESYAPESLASSPPPATARRRPFLPSAPGLPASLPEPLCERILGLKAALEVMEVEFHQRWTPGGFWGGWPAEESLLVARRSMLDPPGLCTVSWFQKEAGMSVVSHDITRRELEEVGAGVKLDTGCCMQPAACIAWHRIPPFPLA